MQHQNQQTDRGCEQDKYESDNGSDGAVRAVAATWWIVDDILLPIAGLQLTTFIDVAARVHFGALLFRTIGPQKDARRDDAPMPIPNGPCLGYAAADARTWMDTCLPENVDYGASSLNDSGALPGKSRGCPDRFRVVAFLFDWGWLGWFGTRSRLTQLC